jgi:disulfide bond formation protein DsbB
MATAMIDRPPMREALKLIAIGGVGIFLAAFVIEALLDATPCPLCILQRVVFLLAGLTAFAALRVSGRARLIGVAALALICTSGCGASLWHLWVQSPWHAAAASCGPGVDYLLDTLPAWEAMVTLLNGEGDCAIPTALLGVPLPAWSLAGFIAGLAGLWVGIRASRRTTLER